MENINTSSKKDIKTRCKNEPSYEEFYQFYITEGHNLKECEEKFNIGHRVISRLVNQWGLVEIAKRTRHWNPPLLLEDIERVYLNTEIGGKEAAKILGTSFSTFRRCLVYYGVHKEHELVQKSIKNAWEKEYVNGHPLRDPELWEKVKENWLEKYGVDNPSKHPDIIEKIKNNETKPIPISYEDLFNYFIITNHNIKECGEHFDVAAHIIDHWLQKYGIKKGKELTRAKIAQTNLEKYGFSNPVQNPEILEKIKQTNLEKYGTNNSAQSHIIHYDQWDTDEHFSDYIKNLPNKQSTLTLSKYFNVTFGRVINRIHKLHLEEYILYREPRSSYEDEIIELLKTRYNIFNIEVNRRDLLPSKREVDIYLPDYKIGIEFNGDYWHCNVHTKFKNLNYHQNKSLEAEKQGIFLFHIFEDEWNDQWATYQKDWIIEKLDLLLDKQKQEETQKEIEKRLNKLRKGESIIVQTNFSKESGSIYKQLGFQEINLSAPTIWYVDFDHCGLFREDDKNKKDGVEDLPKIADCGTKTWKYTK